MITPKSKPKKLFKIQAAVALSMIIASSFSHALDNPDAPDYLGDFKTKAEKYESNMQETADNNNNFLEASQLYEKFLDSEINTAYRNLAKNLSDEERTQLQISQRAWLRFRDEETKFVAQNWRQENFGSSSVISRNMYRVAIMRARIEQLLTYLKNY